MKSLVVDYGLVESSSVPAPVIDIEITNLEENHQKQVEVAIDTGYDGYLVIPLDLYDELALEETELPPHQVPQAVVFGGGIITLRSSFCYILIRELELKVETEVDTHPGCTTAYLGRKFIEMLEVSLNGPEKRSTFIKQ